MAKFKGKTNPINRDAGDAKVRAARQKVLKGLRGKESVPEGDPFKNIPKMAKLPKSIDEPKKPRKK